MEELITAKEASRELGCGLKKIYSFVDNGSITEINTGRSGKGIKKFYKKRDVDRLKKLMPDKIGCVARMPSEELSDEIHISVFEAATMCGLKNTTMDIAARAGFINPASSSVTVGEMRRFMKEYMKNGSSIHNMLKSNGVDPKDFSKDSPVRNTSTDSDPYINMVAAIISSAYLDYVKILTNDTSVPKYVKEDGKWRTYKETEESMREFFDSKWFGTLSAGLISPDMLVRRAKKEASMLM